MRIAFVTPQSPYPPDRGGRIRAHHLWRVLKGLGETATFILGDEPPFAVRERLRAGRVHFYPRRRFSMAAYKKSNMNGRAPGLWEVPLGLDELGNDSRLWRDARKADAFEKHVMSPRRLHRLTGALRAFKPDVVVLSDTSAAFLVPVVKTLSAITIVSADNFDSELYDDISAHAVGAPISRWAALMADGFQRYERDYFAAADRVWVCSAPDAKRFSDALGIQADKINVVPNVVDVGEPVFDSAPGQMTYVGKGNYWPNEPAALALIAMSRRLSRRHIGHDMTIVGRFGKNVAEYASDAPAVRLPGYVQDLKPLLNATRVAPVPLRVGGGTRLKVLEAMALGKPVVATSRGIEGIDVEDGVSALIADDPKAFEESVLELLRDDRKARQIGSAGYELTRERYSVPALRQAIINSIGNITIQLEGRIESVSAPEEVAVDGTINPLSRLLEVNVDFRSDLEFVAADLELRSEPDQSIPNSRVDIGWASDRRPQCQRASVQAVLAPDVDPADLVVVCRTVDGEDMRLTGLDAAIERQSGALWVDSLSLEDQTVSGAVWSKTASEDDTFGEGRIAVSEGTFPIGGGVFGDFGDPMGAASWLRRPLPQDPSTGRLNDLRNRHSGETLWIVGNGPSVRMEDLEALKGRPSIAFNRFYLAFEKTAFRPTYLLSADDQMVADFGPEMMDCGIDNVFFASASVPDISGPFIWLRQIASYPAVFSMEPDKWVNAGGSSVFVALQLAFHMGARNVFLYGCDFRFKYQRRPGADKFHAARGDDNHFIKNYRSGADWCPPSYRDIASGFLCARLTYETHGGSIRNATRGGLLEIFPRSDFDAVKDER